MKSYQLTACNLVLSEASEKPVRSMLDPGEHDSCQVSDVRTDVALERDLPHALLDYVRPCRKERTPRCSTGFKPHQQSNETDHDALAVRWHGQAVQESSRERSLERSQLRGELRHDPEPALALLDESDSLVPLA